MKRKRNLARSKRGPENRSS